MAKNYTSNFKRQVGGTSGAEPSYLLEITHPSLAVPIRVTNDNDKLRRVRPGKYLDLPGFAADGALIALDLDWAGNWDVAAAAFTALGGTMTRAGTATRVNAAGLIEVCPPDTLRKNYDPVTLALRGLLSETPSTNVYLRNSEFDNAAWTKSVVTVTANQAMAPDGTVSMDRIDHPGGAGHIHQSVVTGIGQTWTKSKYAKAGTLDKIYFEFNDGGSFFVASFDLTLGTVIAAGVGNTAKIEPTNQPGVYRCIATRTFAAAGNTGTTYIGNYGASAAGNLYLWGGQAEQRAGASSVIPTTVAGVTRNGDLPNLNSIGSFFNGAEGTLIAEFDTFNSVSTARQSVATFNDGGNQRLALRAREPGTEFPRAAIGTGVAVLSLDGVAYAANTTQRVAVGYGLTQAIAQNGVLRATSATPSSVAATSLALANLGAGNQLDGHLKRLTYLAKRHVDASLVEVSRVPFATYNEEYLACAFRVQFPDDVAGSMPRTPLSIDNIGRELTQWLEAADGGRDADVRVMQVMRDTPEIIEQEYTLGLLNTRQTMMEVTGQLGYENVLDQPALGAMQTPELQPAIF